LVTPRAPSGSSRLPEGQEQLTFDFEELLAGRAPEPSRERARRVGPPAEAPRLVAGEQISALRIAELLNRDRPTAEQLGVIEAGSQPLLVVAGAGSGKTETMAARVVWLVANGLVDPEQVLGLTFTRKAAAELADRVRLRLAALRRIGFRAPGELPGEDPQPVTVSTYHAYAASILTDHGLRLGLETGSRLVGEAGAWQIVDELVERWDGDMAGVEAARSTVVDAVLSLAGECAEHLVTTADIDAVIEGVLDRVADLPAKITEVAPGRPAAAVRTVLDKLAARRRILPIVEAYLRRKRELEVLDFGDQVALAARLAREVPDVGAGERARFRVVLLDEYQDTSHAQLSLLRSLFGGGHPVTAVGDPHQSIYGWRGASAGNLQRFPIDFPDGDGQPARTADLSTSWRNDAAVLEVANQVAGSLRAGTPWAPDAPTVVVPPLRARPGAGPGQVQVHWHATVEDEAAAIAEMADKAWGAGDSVAVLCRARSQFPLLEAAMRVRGLPVEVVGLGGLLHVPEVADLRAALEVLHDASRGDAMMRLLTGAAWRLGPRDLDALGAWAR
ncbi:MAG: ATP-dependent helicase, partial [Kineosporiaceae bacterium]